MATHVLALLGLSPLSLAKDVAKAVFSLVLGLFGTGVADLVAALLGFVTRTSDPVLSGGWWSGSGATLFEQVLLVSGSVLALAFLVSIVTAVVSGDQRLLWRAARRLPVAVLEMALLVGVTAALLSASDELSRTIAAGSSSTLSGFVSLDLAGAIAGSGIVGLIAGLLVVLAGLVLWAELLARTALVYVAVMAGPLIFAASVHPSVGGLRRRYYEAGLALVFSKVVIALALATGSALLSGLGGSSGFAAATGQLLEALAILLIACFSPFLLLKLLMGAEAILMVEGLERRPGRAVLQVAGAATSLGGVGAMVRGLGGAVPPAAGTGGIGGPGAPGGPGPSAGPGAGPSPTGGGGRPGGNAGGGGGSGGGGRSGSGHGAARPGGSGGGGGGGGAPAGHPAPAPARASASGSTGRSAAASGRPAQPDNGTGVPVPVAPRRPSAPPPPSEPERPAVTTPGPRTARSAPARRGGRP
ncbi:MAG: hypothetical protein M0Z46_20970 [Actinomycetota bacterium]|nr:hypothetical protein [Actinomycetota bacterium]